MIISSIVSFFCWCELLIAVVGESDDRHAPLKILFCNEIKQVRSIFNSVDGMDYVFKDPEKQFMTRVKLRNDFMLDQFVADRRLNSDGFYSTGTYVRSLSMFLLIGISRMQIAGHFENREEIFDLSHAIYFDDHLEIFLWNDYNFVYESECYLYASIDKEEAYFRVYKLNFCRDSNAKFFTRLNEPCYIYNGSSKGAHIEPVFLNMTIPNKIDPHTHRPEYVQDVNPQCLELVNKKDIFKVKPNFNGTEQKNHSHAVLNTLFPYEFSFQSRGGLFRSLVFFQGRLYWLENTPVLKYRYLEELTDPHGNYSDKWIEGKVDGSEGIADSFYFAGAFVFPQYGNYLDEVYFLLLPKNFTFETVPIYRKVVTMLPLKFTKENYTLDAIIGKSCEKWLANLMPTKEDHHTLFAVTLVTFLILFLGLVTLFAVDFSRIKRNNLFQSEDHLQSALLQELESKRKSNAKLT